MSKLEEKDFKIFDIFKNKWGIVSAGNIDNFNGCTVGWGTMGTLWNRKGIDGSIVTIFIHPARHTLNNLLNSDTFTLSFFPDEYKKALSYMGVKSGKDEDKIKNAGLTISEIDGDLIYNEANLSFVCRKVYTHKINEEELPKDIQDYYMSNPKVYPLNSDGEWQAHYMFIGEIKKVIEK